MHYGKNKHMLESSRIAMTHSVRAGLALAARRGVWSKWPHNLALRNAGQMKSQACEIVIVRKGPFVINWERG